MGTTGKVTVRADGAVTARSLIATALARIEDLERRWSRFQPASEVSRLNAAPRNRPVMVSAETFRLVSLSIEGWRTSDHAFDPTVLNSVIAIGYDRPFDQMEPGPSVDGEPRAPGAPSPGPEEIRLDPDLSAITLPVGVSLDPGGIGKGLAADLVATEIMSAGGQGALVDIGGDIRTVGEGPYDGAWVVDIENPIAAQSDAPPVLRVAVRDAGVATSSTLKRRWATGDGVRHHLIDPRTGTSLVGRFLAATAIATTAAAAEVATKAALVHARTDVMPGAHVVLIDDRGRLHRSSGLEGMHA